MAEIEMSPLPDLASRLVALTELDWAAGVAPEAVAGVLGAQVSRDEDQVAFPDELAAGELNKDGRLNEVVWVVAREFPSEFFGSPDDEEGVVDDDVDPTSVAEAAADLAAEIGETLGTATMSDDDNGWQLWSWTNDAARLEVAFGEVDGIDLIEATVNAA